MGAVIDFWEWRRERLGAVQPRTYQRRPRQGRGEGSKPTAAGLVLTEQLLKSLRDLE